MSKIQTILKYEFLNVLRSRSFIFTLFLLPLIGFIAVLVMSALQKNNQAKSIFSFLTPPAKIQTMGLIDHSGIIKVVPEYVAGQIVGFLDDVSAREAVGNGEIAGYYVVAADYLTSGQVDLYKSELNVMGESDRRIYPGGFHQPRLV